MKDPKRYGHKAIIYPKANDDTYITIPVEDPDGQWISYNDYARLQTELARLRASSFVTAVPVEQYERVVKAGDAMAEIVKGTYCIDKPAALIVWNAAKEGKPSA